MNTYFDRFQPLNARDLSKIHSRTVDILVNTGMWIESERARNIFAKHGFRVEGEIVHFNEKAIEKALDSVPSRFTILARNPKYNLEVGGDNYAFSASGGSPFFMEYDGTQRAACKDDFINFVKMTQSYDILAFQRDIVRPSADICDENVHIWELLESIRHTEKPCYVTGSNKESIDMLCILFGITKEKMKEDSARGITYAVGNINPVSPLCLTSTQSDNLIELSEFGIPNIIAPMPTAGMSAPVTIPGLLVSQNCEIIGTIVLSQLVNPGAPVIYGTIGAITDMKSGSAPIGAPDDRVIESASAQIARFYGLPTRGDGCLTDSFCCDFQAGAEAALHCYNSVRCGINLIPGCGELGSWMHGSLEKLVLDVQIAEYVNRMVKPIEVNEKNLAVDLIEKVGPRGSYITEVHTLKNFKKEFYRPFLFQRTVYDKWVKAGKKEIKEYAHEEVKKVLESYQLPDIDKSIMQELEKYAVEHYPVK